ncbi:MAG TPA: efflux transporter outer membrane subunit [Polyangiaceae bacterium]
MFARRARVALFCLVGTACAAGPDYKRPAVVTPDKWRDSGAADASIANVPWWELFQDAQLRTLIKVALAENRDLKIAVERIEEARAAYGIAKADFYPHVNAELKAGGLNPSDASLTHTPEGDGGAKAIYSASLGFSWELDFFGRIRRASEAQKAALLATEEARRAVALSLVSDVALAYLELRGLDRRLDISRTTLKARKEHVDYSRTRYEGSVANEVDWRQAQAEQHRIEAVVYDYEKLVAQRENELSFLLGRNPAAITRDRAAQDQPVPPEVPAGLPAQLLERRPDVRRAEMDLWSATARIGEAKAMLYPRIALTGSYGLASTDLGNFVDPSSQSWNVFASLLQPIFEGGKNTARVEMRESQQRQAVYAYERTLLQALREVEDALTGLHSAGQQRLAQGARVGAERKVLELAELRYRGGVSDYLPVLDAQRSLFTAEIDEATTATEHTKSLIRLYKALGGGWPAPKGAGSQPPKNAPAAAASAAAGAQTTAPAPSAAPPAPAAPAPAAPPATPTARPPG